MNPLLQSTEHVVRAMTFLALHRGEGYFLARDVAGELGIPGPYLAKLLRPLAARGVLESQRGRGGGFRLAAPPAEVRLLDLFDEQEQLSGSRRCLLGQDVCADESACPVHDAWKAARDRLVVRLGKTTLADLVRFCQRHPESGYPGPTPPRSRRRRAR